MTKKFMLDESSHALHRVAGWVEPWEELGPGIRVRRRVVRPLEPTHDRVLATWVSTFSADFDDPAPKR